MQQVIANNKAFPTDKKNVKAYDIIYWSCSDIFAGLSSNSDKVLKVCTTIIRFVWP